jgi:hypothetical protein
VYLCEGLLDEQGFALEMFGLLFFERVAPVDLATYKVCIVAST